MAKHKTPGQKRRRLITIICAVLFIASSLVGGIIVGKFNTDSLEWVNNHKTVNAIVTTLEETEEEYTRKGRTRYRTVYYMDYTFNVDGNEYNNYVKIDSSTFYATEQGDTVEVWYSDEDPYVSDTKDNVEADVSSNNIVGNSITVAPYTAIACLFLNWLLKVMFGRESKTAMPEGAFTETTWLDIDDNYMVAIDGDDLVFFDIDSKRSDSVQEAYQNGASLEDLLGMSKSSKLKRVPLAEVSELESHHNSDTISITHREDTHSVEFLNQAVKAHALERIQKLLPNTMSHAKKERTRIQSMMPSSIALAILVAIGLFADMFLLNIALGFIAIVWVIPRIISRLIDPTVTDTWTVEVAEEPENLPAS